MNDRTIPAEHMPKRKAYASIKEAQRIEAEFGPLGIQTGESIEDYLIRLRSMASKGHPRADSEILRLEHHPAAGPYLDHMRKTTALRLVKDD